MRSFVPLLLVLGCLVRFSLPTDVYYKKIDYMMNVKGEQKAVHVRLIFDETSLIIAHKKKPEKKVYVTIPLEGITHAIFEQSAHPRYIPVPIVPGLGRSTEYRHWLTIYFKEDQYDEYEEFVLLRLDKSNYQAVIATLETSTGLTVRQKIRRIIRSGF
jgi:hypothetical protein